MCFFSGEVMKAQWLDRISDQGVGQGCEFTVILHENQNACRIVTERKNMKLYSFNKDT